MKYKFQLLHILLSIIVLISCNSNTKREDYKEITSINNNFIDGYVGDINCKSCHEEAFTAWKGSHHELAMQIANDSTVLGDFNNVQVSIDGVEYHFTKEINKFFVEINEIDGTNIKYEITYTFGVIPLQQYLIEFDKGKKQVLRATWDSDKNKWYHQYAGDKIEPYDWLHWTNGAQNWNTMCAECHSTNLKKNYLVEKDSFHTTYSVINVSCESCHGPGEKHVNWSNENPESKESHYIIGGKTQVEQMNLCAPCHARRVKLTENLEPGIPFEDQYMVQTLLTDFYHGDGQIKEEDYVYGSFLQSKMYKNKIKCGDCHDMHSLKLKKSGNALCMQCHVPKYDTPEHHFHKVNTDASACINCHMTGKNYMGNDFRRDHSFRVPRPDQSVEFGTPNACTGCHKDQTNAWAADYIKKWYGPKRPDHFSDALLLSSSANLSGDDRKKLDRFINDLNYPAIARATVIDNLNYSSNEQFEALLTSLSDSSAIVRYNALMKFRDLSLPDRLSIAIKHANDETKLVRIGAAQLVIGTDTKGLIEADRLVLDKSKEELEKMMYSNADFSTGRMQLGDYFLQNNDLATAIKHYKLALQKDSLLTPVYSNLATAYSMQGQTDLALQTLNTFVELELDNTRAYYLRALLFFELKRNEEAVADLNKAIQLAPTETRTRYNLATFYFQEKQLEKAEKEIKAALKIEPNNQDYKYLLALIYRDQGKFKSGQKIMQELRENQAIQSN